MAIAVFSLRHKLHLLDPDLYGVALALIDHFSFGTHFEYISLRYKQGIDLSGPKTLLSHCILRPDWTVSTIVQIQKLYPVKK